MLPTIKLLKVPLNSAQDRNHASAATEEEKGPPDTDNPKEGVGQEEMTMQPYVLVLLANLDFSELPVTKFFRFAEQARKLDKAQEISISVYAVLQVHLWLILTKQKRKHNSIHRDSSMSYLGCHIKSSL